MFKLEQPKIDNSDRTVFDLPYGVIDKSMILTNVGLYNANCSTDTGVYYPALAGVLGLLKEVTLYSGAQIISQYRQPAMNGLIGLKTLNSTAEDLDRYELLNGAALDTRGDALDYTPLNKDYNSEYYDVTAVNNVGRNRFHNQLQPPNSNSNGALGGVVELNRILDVLAVPGSLNWLPNLRLEIVWETRQFYAYREDPNRKTAIAGAFAHLQPRLAMMVLVENEIPVGDMGKKVELAFLEKVVDRVIIAQNTSGATQSQSMRINGFNGKFVNDLTLIFNPDGQDNWVLRNDRSVCPEQEQIQLIVNGENYLPFSNVVNEAEKMRRAMMIHGNLNVPLAGALEGIANGANKYLSADAANAANSTSHIASNANYHAYIVGKVVERLELQHSRAHSGTAAKNAEYTLYVIGSCPKIVTYKVGDKQVNISA